MRKISIKFLSLSLILLIPLVSCVSYAEDITVTAPKLLKLTVKDAVNNGISNSLVLKQIRSEIELAIVSRDRAYESDRTLSNAQRDLSAANSKLIAKKVELDNFQAQVTKGLNSENLSETAKNELLAQQALINANKAQLAQASTTLNNAESGLVSALGDVGTKIGEKINSPSLSSYNVKYTGQLLVTMADVSLTVTANSYDIYKNQIAMQIQKNYYDVLRLKAIVDAKSKAMERGEKQAKFSQDSYDAGMKAKDDMLIASTYYDGTKIEYKKAVGDLNNAIIEFKKSLNVPFDTEIELLDPLVDTVEPQDLKTGLESGLEKRIEMQKAKGQVVVYDKNFDAADHVSLPNTFQYREAKILKEKARTELENTKLTVSASIYQSYETVKTVGEMLEDSKLMLGKAQETVDIATYKYQEGFGIENSLLKKLDIESSSGTIVEVLAAEQNLIEIEEKIIEIKYNYNLAKAKYLNDIGILTY